MHFHLSSLYLDMLMIYSKIVQELTNWWIANFSMKITVTKEWRRQGLKKYMYSKYIQQVCMGWQMQRQETDHSYQLEVLGFLLAVFTAAEIFQNHPSPINSHWAMISIVTMLFFCPSLWMVLLTLIQGRKTMRMKTKLFRQRGKALRQKYLHWLFRPIGEAVESNSVSCSERTQVLKRQCFLQQAILMIRLCI